MGLRYVRGLREETAQALLRERLLAPFASIHDLTRRVPELRKDELTTLAEIGALNSVASSRHPVSESIPRFLRPSHSLGGRNDNDLHSGLGDSRLATRFTAAMPSGRSNAPSAPLARCLKISPSPTRLRPCSE